MKGHKIVLISIASSILLAALITMVCVLSICRWQDNRNAAAVPELDADNNQGYFTANSSVSQDSTKNSGSSSAEVPAAETESSISAASVTYVVKTFQGKIGVFAGDPDTPIQTLNVEVATLPESDRQALEQGITVEGRDSLRRLLEDYES